MGKKSLLKKTAVEKKDETPRSATESEHRIKPDPTDPAAGRDASGEARASDTPDESTSPGDSDSKSIAQPTPTSASTQPSSTSEPAPAAGPDDTLDRDTIGTQPLTEEPGTYGSDNRLWVYLGIACFVLVLLLVGASRINSQKYRLVKTDDGIEIWRGIFAPAGFKKTETLRGVQLPDPRRSRYTRDEVYTLAFLAYMRQANEYLSSVDVPNFEKIRFYLSRAGQYAFSEAMRAEVDRRLTHMELTTLLYKARVAAAGDTAEGIQKALDYLRQASALDINRQVAEQIRSRIDALKTALESRRTPRTQTAVRDSSAGVAPVPIPEVKP